jgi:phage terminase small subunit
MANLWHRSPFARQEFGYMAKAITPKQLKFCQKYVETGNASEAYRQSYDIGTMKPESIHRKAKELLDNVKIAARIADIQAKHQKRHEVTVDSLTSELEEARSLALKTEQPAAMVSASLGKAKLHGMLVDRNEHTGKDGGPIETTETVTIYLPDNGRNKKG